MTNKNLIEFYSETCRPCKIMLPMAEKAAKEAGIPVSKYEIGKESEKAEEYRVKSVPTLILMSEGAEVRRLVGAVSKNELENFLKS